MMPEIMTTKELSRYLKIQRVTISKYAAEGKIPAVRIGGVGRFDRDVTDDWRRTRQKEAKADGTSKKKGDRKKPEKKKPVK